MIPSLGSGNQVIIQNYKDKTYRIDFENKRIVGTVDGLDALVQAARKIIATERYSERIYSGDYGIELQRLVGKSIPFVEANLPLILEEAFLTDTRINEVTEVDLTSNRIDELHANVRIQTRLGTADLRFVIGV